MGRPSWIVLAIAILVTPTRSPAGEFVSLGGSGLRGPDGMLACIYVAQHRRPGRPKPHGILCGLVNHGAGTAALGGPSFAVVLTRRGRIRCASPAAMGLQGSFHGGLLLKLSADRCGLGEFSFPSNSGNGRERSAGDGPTARAADPPAATSRGAGKRFRQGALRCVALTSADLMRYDANLATKDAVVCFRRKGAAFVQTEGAVFENGDLSTDCGVLIDPATGCGSMSACGLPDIPVCP